MYTYITLFRSCFSQVSERQWWRPRPSSGAGSRGGGTGRTRSSRSSFATDVCAASTGTSRWSVIRPLNPETDAAVVVELIHESFPPGRRRRELVATAREYPAARQARGLDRRDRRHRRRARGGRAEVGFRDGLGFVGVSVHPAFGDEASAAACGRSRRSTSKRSRRPECSAMFTETPEGVEFARARAFAELRAETLSCVDPRTVEADSHSTGSSPSRRFSGRCLRRRHGHDRGRARGRGRDGPPV